MPNDPDDLALYLTDASAALSDASDFLDSVRSAGDFSTDSFVRFNEEAVEWMAGQLLLRRELLDDWTDQPEHLLEEPSLLKKLEEFCGEHEEFFGQYKNYAGPAFEDFLNRAGNAVRRLACELERIETPQLLRDKAADNPIIQSQIVTIAQRLVDKLGPDVADWLALGPRLFEEVLADVWSAFGWETILTPPTRDGGFDIRAVRNERGTTLCYLIEAKAYGPERPVGVNVVRSLYGVVERERASHGIVATTSRFTRDAERWTNLVQYRLTLAGFDTVLQWLAAYKAFRAQTKTR